MREAGAKIPFASGVGRASDRSRKARRDKARKSSVYGKDSGGSTSLEDRDFRVAIHLDMLEGITENAAAGGDDDDDYDEFADLRDEDEKGKGTKGTKKKRPRKGAAKNKQSTAKYLRARSLGSILIEETSRSDSTAKQYVAAAVRRYDNKAAPNPPRKFCPVTGLFGIYTEPKSQIPYANLKALEQIRERAPPWMNTGSGNATYHEAVKTLKNDA